VPPEKVHVIVPGVDPARFFQWTPTTIALVEALDLLSADGVLLLPARLTRRKNVELALRVLAALRTDGLDWRLIVSGPPGPHNPSNRGYLGTLLDLRAALGLDAAAHFIYEHGEDGQPLIPDDDTMANLFHLADALFFPSTQEGFGIPVLEAGLIGLPVFCSDIPPFRGTGGSDVTYFDPTHDAPDTIAARVREQLAADRSARLRVRVRQRYTWAHLIRTQLVPLLEGTC
jgi:mannosylglucosylglycerate synthase